MLVNRMDRQASTTVEEKLANSVILLMRRVYCGTMVWTTELLIQMLSFLQGLGAGCRIDHLWTPASEVNTRLLVAALATVLCMKGIRVQTSKTIVERIGTTLIKIFVALKQIGGTTATRWTSKLLRVPDALLPEWMTGRSELAAGCILIVRRAIKTGSRGKSCPPARERCRIALMNHLR